MKIRRVKILSSFRGLPEGYEVLFDPSANTDMIEPICFVGLNGSGKSNVLEAIAEIFYYLETYHKADSKRLSTYKTSFGFEIEYYLPKFTFDMGRTPWEELTLSWNELGNPPLFKIVKEKAEYPVISAVVGDKEIVFINKDNNRNASVLPTRIIAYSSGMNELISNPFIKIDLHYFDDFERTTGESADASLDINRMFFMDYESNKLITVANFLFDQEGFDKDQFVSDSAEATEFGALNLNPLKDEVKITNLKSFSMTIRLRNTRNEPIQLPSELNLALDALEKCATFCEESVQGSGKGQFRLYELSFWVNEATKRAFQHYFKNAYELYRRLYFLRLLNTHLLSRDLRKKIKSADLGINISDLLPKHEEEKLVFSVNAIAFLKEGAKREVYYRQLSDGEHQLLQVLGTMLLMDTPGTLFILDEPETHFNPEWRSKFVSLLNSIINNKRREQDIILTSHSPFIVSDCKSNRVFIFSRDEKGNVMPPVRPTINTFGTSMSILTEEIFGKKETISELSISEIERIKGLPLNTLEDIRNVSMKMRHFQQIFSVPRRRSLAMAC
jgi:restriction system-associated AAA family ATPase